MLEAKFVGFRFKQICACLHQVGHCEIEEDGLDWPLARHCRAPLLFVYLSRHYSI